MASSVLVGGGGCAPGGLFRGHTLALHDAHEAASLAPLWKPSESTFGAPARRERQLDALDQKRGGFVSNELCLCGGSAQHG